MDDIFDFSLGAVYKFLKGIIYDLICYSVGWVVLRVFTLGSYPREGLGSGLRDPESSESMPNIIGVILIAIVTYQIFK